MSVTWQPPARPRWVTRLNDHAVHTSTPAVCALDPDDLLTTARTATGLDDFGTDDWRTHFDVLVDGISREGNLHPVGQLMTRTDLVRALENRLELTDLWARRPEILDTPIVEPLFVVGAARSGTSILHELLGLDPHHREPTTWKVHRPLVAAEGSPAQVADARRSVDAVVQFWHDVQPEYEAMHHNDGELPTECIFITVPTFLSDNWGGTHTSPTYDLHLATADHTPAYEWHKRTLQTLQPPGSTTRWVLKAPSHLPTLRRLFAVYPDARVIHIHRDPARTLPSMFDLMGTLKWMRTDTVELDGFVDLATDGIAHLQRRVIADRADATLPDEQFHDLRYADLLADPVGALRSAYEHFGWTFDPVHGTAITDYLAARPQGSRGTHHYRLADFGLTAADVHRRFADYLDRFAVPHED